MKNKSKKHFKDKMSFHKNISNEYLSQTGKQTPFVWDTLDTLKSYMDKLWALAGWARDIDLHCVIFFYFKLLFYSYSIRLSKNNIRRLGLVLRSCHYGFLPKS